MKYQKTLPRKRHNKRLFPLLVDPLNTKNLNFQRQFSDKAVQNSSQCMLLLVTDITDSDPAYSLGSIKRPVLLKVLLQRYTYFYVLFYVLYTVSIKNTVVKMLMLERLNVRYV